MESVGNFGYSQVGERGGGGSSSDRAVLTFRAAGSAGERELRVKAAHNVERMANIV